MNHLPIRPLVPTYALAKMTAGHVKVALSGDGGDEVFGGYPKYLMGHDRSGRIPGHRMLDRSLRGLNWRPRGMSHLYWRTLTPERSHLLVLGPVWRLSRIPKGSSTGSRGPLSPSRSNFRLL